MVRLRPRIPLVAGQLFLTAGSYADSKNGGVAAKLKEQYHASHNNLRGVDTHLGGDGSTNSYVFLQKFPLQDSDDLLFHTEVLVCSRADFSADDQKFLDDKVASLTDFVEIDESWWSTKTTTCTEFGYGGNSCTKRCCAVPHGADETDFPLNEHRAVISNAKVEEKSLYLYGTGKLDGEGAYHATCDKKCWSNWAGRLVHSNMFRSANENDKTCVIRFLPQLTSCHVAHYSPVGTDYNPLTNNCNTFTSTVLHCVFGLSEKKPKLGPSDMVTVTCDKCPSSFLESGSFVGSTV